MPGRALATTKNFEKSSFFLFSMFPQSMFVAWNGMLTHRTP